MANPFESLRPRSVEPPATEPNTLSSFFSNAGESFQYALLESPYNAIAQTVNHIRGSQVLALREPPRPANPYSSDWVAQQIGGGIGTVLPFIAVGSLSRLGQARGVLAQTSSASFRHHLFLGAAYGGLLTPVDERHDFWGQKLIGTVSGAISFGAMDGVNTSMRALGTCRYRPLRFMMSSEGLNHVGSGLIIGSLNADIESYAHTGHGATNDQRLQSAISFALLNGSLLTGRRLTEVGLNRHHHSPSSGDPPTAVREQRTLADPTLHDVQIVDTTQQGRAIPRQDAPRLTEVLSVGDGQRPGTLPPGDVVTVTHTTDVVREPVRVIHHAEPAATAAENMRQPIIIDGRTGQVISSAETPVRREPTLVIDAQTGHRAPGEQQRPVIIESSLRELSGQDRAAPDQSSLARREGTTTDSVPLAETQPESRGDQPRERQLRFIPEVVTDREAQHLWDVFQEPDQLVRMKAEVNAVGVQPEVAMVQAVRQNRIVGLGELHLELNAFRDHGASLMHDFAREGATHLAVEVSRCDQPILDRLMETGSLSAADRQLLKQRYPGMHDNYFDMLEAAQRAGLRIVAVDCMKEAGMPQGSAEEIATQRDIIRNQHMADEIARIVENDPNAKVLFWIGMNHLEGEGAHTRAVRSAASLLRERGNRNGYTIETFGGIVAENQTILSMNVFAAAAHEPVSVATARTTELRRFPKFAVQSEAPVLIGDIDHIVLYPREAGLRLLERRLGAHHPRLLSALDSISSTHLRERCLEPAIELQLRALEIDQRLDPASTSVAERHRRLGLTFEVSGDRASARTHYERSLELQERHANGAETEQSLQEVVELGRFHLLGGEVREGAMYYARALSGVGRGVPMPEQSYLRLMRGVQGLAEHLYNHGDMANANTLLRTAEAVDQIYRSRPPA